MFCYNNDMNVTGWNQPVSSIQSSQPPTHVEGSGEFVDKMAKIAATIGGGVVSVRNLPFPSPQNMEPVIDAWKTQRSEIAQRIGPMPQVDGPGTGWEWENTARTANDLLVHAHTAKPVFERFLDRVVSEIPNVEVSFGPDRKFVMKSEASLKTKLHSMASWSGKPAEECAPLVNDMLRGSIIAHDPESLKQSINHLSTLAKKEGWDVTFNNKFEGNSPSGYVGVNSKLMLSFQKEGVKQSMMCEVQFHLSQVFDGTKACPKELSHSIYEVTREIDNRTTKSPEELKTLEECKGASFLLYLTALKDVPSP